MPFLLVKLLNMERLNICSLKAEERMPCEIESESRKDDQLIERLWNENMVFFFFIGNLASAVDICRFDAHCIAPLFHSEFLPFLLLFFLNDLESFL